MKRLTCLVLLITCASAFGGEKIDERRDADPHGRVEVSNISGEITVSGWDQDAVEITGTLGSGVERLDFIREGSLTTIEVIYPRHGRSSGSDLHIRVPRDSDLEVVAVSAPIRVSGVEGQQRLKTVSGSVKTEVFSSDLEAESVSGNVTATGRDAATHTLLKTISGSIESTGTSGDLEASTISGGIEVAAEMFSRARLSTTNGRIELAGGLASDGRFDLSTTNGRVKLRLDRDADLDLDAQSFNGEIENCFGVAPIKNRYSPERTLRFQRGEGNRTVRIRTMNGRIDVCADQVSS